jgi:hypothetical protein
VAVAEFWTLGLFCFMNALLLILIGLITGFVISGCIGFYLFRRLDARWSKLLAIYDLSQPYKILEALRSEKTAHAIKLSESSLDAGILGLGRLLRSVSSKHRNADDVYWLRKAKEYRAKYPRTTGLPNIDSGIAEAFALVD